VEVYKLYNINDLADMSAKNNNMATINLDPTIDERIPDKYRIDAVDNRNLVYKGKKEEQADKKE
ncbi:MAG: hypothetical protein LBT84_00885, partial [Spirochaetia bacterium]|nr:hypothetical protein [Spirochaetia bacterium]